MYEGAKLKVQFFENKNWETKMLRNLIDAVITYIWWRYNIFTFVFSV